MPKETKNVEQTAPAEVQQTPPAQNQNFAVIPEKAQEALEDLSVNTLLLNPQVFGYLQTLSQIMASGQATIPEHLRGNASDCMAVIMQASQWKMNPWAVAQKTHIIGGSLGYEAQLVNAVVVNSGLIEGAFKYEWFGPWEKIIGKFQWKKSSKGNDYQVPGWTPADEAGVGIKISAIIIGESKPRDLSLLLSQATVRNSTLWASDPKQQLAYLAVKRWARLYAPGCILGVYTPDELEQSFPKGIKNITPVGETQTEKLLDILEDDQPAKEKAPANDPAPPEEADYKLPDNERRKIFAKLKEKGINKDYFKNALGIVYNLSSTNEIPLERLDEVLNWIDAGCPGPEEKAGQGVQDDLQF